MRQLVALVCLLILASACAGGDTQPAGPSPVPLPAHPALPPPQSVTAPRVISVDEEVTDTLTFHGADKLFELTAPSDGTLVVRLSWDPRRGRLELDLADRLFAHFPDNRSPIVGELPVVVGGKYRVRVADGAPWDYDDMFVAFEMTTSME
jgi:hypothetical protein